MWTAYHRASKVARAIPSLPEMILRSRYRIKDPDEATGEVPAESRVLRAQALAKTTGLRQNLATTAFGAGAEVPLGGAAAASGVGHRERFL